MQKCSLTDCFGYLASFSACRMLSGHSGFSRFASVESYVQSNWTECISLKQPLEFCHSVEHDTINGILSRHARNYIRLHRSGLTLNFISFCNKQVSC